MCSFYCHQNNGEKMGPSPILSVIHTFTIGAMLNFHDSKDGSGIENVTCKQTLKESLR